MKRRQRGFTLVDGLIVVIILGILTAIVIPRFVNASNDRRNDSNASTLRTIRSQVELFKLQHGDNAPLLLGMWTIMLGQSSTTELRAAVATGTNFGPYMQQASVNPANGQSEEAASAATNVGWVYSVSGGSYTISAVNTTGTGLLT